MEYKSTSFELKAEPDDSGTFEGYASVFGVTDRGADIVMPGAFQKSLAERKVRMLWQHDTREVIGIWSEVKEDERGLFVKGRLLGDVAKGKEAISLLKAGAIDSMSIGYRTVEASEEGRVRKLHEVDLYEVSLVTFPMNELTQVTAVKSITTERDFENFLRDAGFSRKEATAIALHGFKASQRDAGRGDESEGIRSLYSQLTQLKEKING